MALSFAQLWEQIEKDKARASPLMGSGEENRSLVVVRAGKILHKEGQAPFWDEFISLCNNTEGMAQLLGVGKEMVATWPAKIQEALDKLERHNAHHPSEDEKDEVMPTGDNGAVSFTNQDPKINMGDEQ
jgi:hypothetical protein